MNRVQSAMDGLENGGNALGIAQKQGKTRQSPVGSAVYDLDL